MADELDRPTAGLGLFSGFEGYQTPSDGDYQRVLTEGLVVPDANVLLSLYRYNSQSRSDLLMVLERFGDRLWIPHQAVAEFWRNREAVLQDPESAGRQTLEALQKQQTLTAGVVRTWANRVALQPDELQELLNPVTKAFEGLLESVRELVEAEAVAPAQDTNEDLVVSGLTRVLQGRVGAPPTPERLSELVEEGLRRVGEGIPPGFKDKAKPGSQAAGDYLVWAEVLREATERRCDVLFITGDVKEDWWRQERGRTRGPRLELVEELWAASGTRLFMLRPENLLRRAKIALQVEVSPASVEDVGRIDRSVSHDSLGGWTQEAMSELLETLSFRSPVQSATIRFAAANSGFIHRKKVYEIGDYAEKRTLKGFTKPVTRTVQEMRDSGTLPADAIDVLETVYNPSFSYVQASGFSVPSQLVPLIQSWSSQEEIE